VAPPMIPTPPIETVPAIHLNYSIWVICVLIGIVCVLVVWIFNWNRTDWIESKKEFFSMFRSVESNISAMAQGIVEDRVKIDNHGEKLDDHSRKIEDHGTEIGNLRNDFGKMEVAIKPLL